jgi:formate hydrogenlyase transcriptional activator
MEKTLQEHLRFEQLMSDISARFINIYPDRVDAEIENALREVLEFFQIDRCGLLRSSPGSTTWQVTHLAVSAGMPTVPVNTDLAVALFPWAYRKLIEQGEMIIFNTLDALPAEAHTDKQTYSEWGIRSSVDMPISIDVDKHYIFSINAMRSERAWPEEYIPRLRLLGEIFVNALLRAKARLQLEERLRMERLFSALSTHFLNAPPEQVDAEIESGLREVTEFLDVERGILGQSYEDREQMIVTHSWAAPGFEKKTGVIASTEVPWIFRKVMRGETAVCERIEDLPVEASRDKNYLQGIGSLSNISVPLITGGEVLGFVGFGSLRRQINWPDKIIQGLKVAAQIFANALARKRADLALRESEMRLDLAASSAGTGLWTLELGTGHIWATDKARELFGYSREEKITFKTFLNTVHPDDRGLIREAVEQSIKLKENLKTEYRIVLAGESMRWIVSRGRPYFSMAGDPERMMGVSMDVTERKQSEESLRKAYDEIKQLKDQLAAENIYLREEISRESDFEHIIGKSAPIRHVVHQVEQVAATGSTVLLSGETGTGKELIAQAIHNLSPRRGRLMVKVNCASLPASLIESELFGREKGAYTGALSKQIGRFELADCSTLFLDEITELPPDLQAKLLRVLQNGEFERLGSPKTLRVDVRLIAATNRDMEEEVRKGAFREDLYYRLKVFPIEVPPLRERPDDIPLLVQAFLTEFSEKMGKKIQAVPQKNMEALQHYRWPGNIRELRNVIEHGVIISSGSSLQVLLPQAPAGASFQNKTMEEAEYQHIMKVLTKTGWRIKGSNGAASLLGLKPSTLYSRMIKLGIPSRREKDDISS